MIHQHQLSQTSPPPVTRQPIQTVVFHQQTSPLQQQQQQILFIQPIKKVGSHEKFPSNLMIGGHTNYHQQKVLPQFDARRSLSPPQQSLVIHPPPPLRKYSPPVPSTTLKFSSARGGSIEASTTSNNQTITSNAEALPPDDALQLKKRLALTKSQLVESLASVESLESQLKSSEIKRQVLHQTIEDLQDQITSSHLSEESTKAQLAILSLKTSEVFSENSRLIDVFEGMSRDRQYMKQNVETIQKQAAREVYLRDDAVAARQELISCLERDNFDLQQTLCQSEIALLDATIKSEKLEIELSDALSKHQEERQSLSNQLEVLQQQLSMKVLTCEQLNERTEKSEKRLKESNEQLKMIQARFEEANAQALRLTISSTDLEKDLERESVKAKQLEQQKNQTEELKVLLSIETERKEQALRKCEETQTSLVQTVEVNQKITARLHETERALEESISQMNEKTLCAQRQQREISITSKDIAELQQVNVTLMRQHREMAAFNDELQQQLSTNGQQLKAKEESWLKEQLELMTKIEEVMKTNEEVIAVNNEITEERSRLQEEVMMKKKLLMQQYKENQMMREQIIQGVEQNHLLTVQDSHLQELLAALREKDREVRHMQDFIDRTSGDKQPQQGSHLNEAMIQREMREKDVKLHKAEAENQRLYALLQARQMDIQMMVNERERKQLRSACE